MLKIICSITMEYKLFKFYKKKQGLSDRHNKVFDFWMQIFFYNCHNEAFNKTIVVLFSIFRYDRLVAHTIIMFRFQKNMLIALCLCLILPKKPNLVPPMSSWKSRNDLIRARTVYRHIVRRRNEYRRMFCEWHQAQPVARKKVDEAHPRVPTKTNNEHKNNNTFINDKKWW